MCVLIKQNDTISTTANQNFNVQSNNKNEYGFDIDNETLGNLMKLKGMECVEKIHEEYESVNGLAERLQTNVISGLSGDENDIKKRIETFGRNEIPATASKTFIQVSFLQTSKRK